jgi:hypothetical protein
VSDMCEWRGHYKSGRCKNYSFKNPRYFMANATGRGWFGRISALGKGIVNANNEIRTASCLSLLVYLASIVSVWPHVEQRLVSFFI